MRPVVLTVVGYYLPGYKAGGVISCVANIASHLGLEFRFRIVTRDRDLGDLEPYRAIGSADWHLVGVSDVCYLSPDVQSLSYVREVVRRTPHALVYLNSFFDPLCIFVLINRRLGRIPSGPVLLAPQGEFAWPSLRQKYLKKALFMALARLTGLCASVTWHASNDVEADDIARVMKIRRDAIRVAHQLPPTEVPPRKHQRDDVQGDDRVNAVFLSRISPEKNLTVALRVLARVKTRLVFDIVGPVENAAYWLECKRLIEELPPNISVNVLGPIQPSRVFETLARYDVMFFPTAGESYGQVIAESILSGTPVLISTETPWRGMEAAGLGWDFPLADADAFVSVLDQLGAVDRSTRPARREHVARCAREYLAKSDAVSDVRDMFHEAIAHGGIYDE